MKRVMSALALWATIGVGAVSAAEQRTGRGAGGSWGEEDATFPLQLAIFVGAVGYAGYQGVQHERRRRRNQAEARARLAARSLKAVEDTPVVRGT